MESVVQDARALRMQECVVHLGRSADEDPLCSGRVPTAKTTLNPAYDPERKKGLQNEPRLDGPINFTCSVSSFPGPDFCPIFAPSMATMDQKSSLAQLTRSVFTGADAGQ